MEKEKSGVSTALFALVTALAATVSTSALAEKGGRGRHLGVPDVNLGLSKFHKGGAGAGPFVPASGIHVAPGLVGGPVGNGGIPGAAAPGASGLTPSHGLTPPGHLATPGLRLGHTNGAMPATPDPVQPGNGNGLAVGHRDDDVSAVAKGVKQGPVSASDRVAATSQVADRAVSQGNGAMPRHLPTCR